MLLSIQKKLYQNPYILKIVLVIDSYSEGYFVEKGFWHIALFYK